MTVDSRAGAETETPEYGAQTAQHGSAGKPRRFRRRAGGQQRRRRGPGHWLVRFLRRSWMPLLIAVVVAVAAFAVDRLHGMFGKTELTREGSGLVNDPKPFNPKTVVYEIFGPPGTVATINYLDLDAEPQIVRDAVLPWSLSLTTTAPAAAATIVAQGDSDTIGCRITVDGVLKDERSSSSVNAQTFCLVKSG